MGQKWVEWSLMLCCKKIRIFIGSEFVFPFPSQCLSWWQASQIRHFADAKPSMDQIRERVLTVCRAYDKVTADKVFISSIFVTILLCVFYSRGWYLRNDYTVPRSLSLLISFEAEFSWFWNFMIKLILIRYNALSLHLSVLFFHLLCVVYIESCVRKGCKIYIL